MSEPKACGRFVYWWDGEYEGDCERAEGHDGDHFDGMSWYDDDMETRDYHHEGEPPPADLVTR